MPNTLLLDLLNGVDPQAWLADTLEKLVKLWPAARIDELLPWAHPRSTAWANTEPSRTWRNNAAYFDPVAGPSRDQRRSDHGAFVPARRQVTLDAIPARPRLVAEPKSHPFTVNRRAKVTPDRRAKGTPLR